VTAPTQDRPVLDETRLAEAVRSGHVPSMLMVLFQLTGDRKWLSDPYRPTPARGLDDHPTGGLSEELQEEIRTAVVDAVTTWARGTPAAVPTPTGALLGEMASWCFADAVPDEYQDMMAVQMGFGEHPDTVVPVPDPERARRTDFSVAIIGAGISGMYAALRMREIGVPYVIIERADDVGGVWRENTYPGAGVDTPSDLYSFPFFHHPWSVYFARQAEVLQYLHDIADEFDLYPDIRFGTEVDAAEWSDDDQCWTLTVTSANGERSRLIASAVISAVGLFKEPSIPDLPGMDTFDGPIFHSSRWPDDLDLAGKRLAVVGTGASAMQIVPATADVASEVTVFQRTPQWIAPVPRYFHQVPADVHWLFEHMPYYRGWYRVRLGWTFNDTAHPSMQLDPEWEHLDRSSNRINDRHRRFFLQYIEQQLAERPDLLAKSVPAYPPYGKRLLMDNGWYDAIKKPGVELVDDGVAAITPTGLRTAGGDEYGCDVIALCTGFDTNRYLQPIEFHGRDGMRLHDMWEDDSSSAYLGVMTKNFPNLFFMYGPATNAGGGSFLSLADSWLRCITALIREMVDSGAGAVVPKADVHDEYNRAMDAANERMVWSHPGMGTYVRNSRGRVTVNMPWRIVDYWHMTAYMSLAGFEFTDRTNPDLLRALTYTWPVTEPGSVPR
jgi:4-hydroxyacetophenone monooxygenase